MSKIWKYILEKRFNYIDAMVIAALAQIINDFIK